MTKEEKKWTVVGVNHLVEVAQQVSIPLDTILECFDTEEVQIEDKTSLRTVVNRLLTLAQLFQENGQAYLDEVAFALSDLICSETQNPR